MEINDIINEIPFFKNKSTTVEKNIYFNDNAPACFLVHSDGVPYKIRIPNILNPESVDNEREALTILAEYNISNVPKIISNGQTLDSGMPYLIEPYYMGDSLDKLQDILTIEDWDKISEHILFFLCSIQAIQSNKFKILNTSYVTYDNYGDMLRDRILKHLKKSLNAGLITSEVYRGVKTVTQHMERFFTKNHHFCILT